MSKRICTVILPILVVTMLSGCMFGLFNDNVHQSLGEYTECEIYMSDDWINTAYYEKYYYSDFALAENEYFIHLTSRYNQVFFEYIHEYEQRMDFNEPEDELNVNYDFDHSIVDRDDYFYIYDDSMEDDYYDQFQSFFIYFYDTQTNVLYYFEANN